MLESEVALTNVVAAFMVCAELFAERFCVEFTLKCINSVGNGQLKDCKALRDVPFCFV